MCNKIIESLQVEPNLSSDINWVPFWLGNIELWCLCKQNTEMDSHTLFGK